MHDCPYCGEACSCDQEDVWHEVIDECDHECDEPDDEDDFEVLDAD